MSHVFVKNNRVNDGPIVIDGDLEVTAGKISFPVVTSAIPTLSASVTAVMPVYHTDGSLVGYVKVFPTA